MKTSYLRIVALVLVTLGSGCTMSVSPPAAPASTTASPAKTTSAAFPIGVYAIRGAVIDFRPDGTHHIFDAKALYVEGHYTLAGDRITMVDTGGQYACKPDGTQGVYTWSHADAAITLTLVSDACEARRTAMAESPFKATTAP